ncbi:MAG: NADH:flavin oxidoreductase [Desulfobacterales bacterium]|nr:NADH:flavin oxidoreductase [Desulfobacterales bacterium]
MATDIFSPFKLNRYELKNRLGVAPMTRISSPGDSVPRPDVLDFLVTRARNGASVVFSEAIVTDYESAQGYPRQARLTTQRQIDAWRPVTKAIREAGAVSICQMFHCGRMAWPEVNPAGRVIAPSPVAPKQNNPLTGAPYTVPDEMSQFDIDHVISGFAETAMGAMEAGFDGVEVHAAHGYLTSQFLSAYSNQRTDGYGGSLENRFRFAHEVISAVRDLVPEDRILTARISNWGIADMEVPHFGSAEEWQALVRLFSGENLDAISVSTYDFSEKQFANEKTMAQLTREATDLPLMICGKIHDRASAQDALEHADIALSGKSMLLNPNWVADVQSGKVMAPHKAADADIAYSDTPLP